MPASLTALQGLSSAMLQFNLGFTISSNLGDVTGETASPSLHL